MNSLPKQAVIGGVAAALAAVATGVLGVLPPSVALMPAGALAALVYVAFAAQTQGLRDEQRFVYRPVYARRQGVQRRVRSDD